MIINESELKEDIIEACADLLNKEMYEVRGIMDEYDIESIIDRMFEAESEEIHNILRAKGLLR